VSFDDTEDGAFVPDWEGSGAEFDSGRAAVAMLVAIAVMVLCVRMGCPGMCCCPRDSVWCWALYVTCLV
jgi:hypothetical protein